jgi:hypothetical protein
MKLGFCGQYSGNTPISDFMKTCPVGGEMYT